MVETPIKYPDGHPPRWWRKHPQALQKAIALLKPKAVSQPQSKPDRFNEFLSLVSLALTLGSWGWTVISPESSIWFGSALLLMGLLATLLAIVRVWPIGKLVGFGLVVAALSAFLAFDWLVVIQPQRGKEFKTLLVEGYHVSDECAVLPGKEEMPEWIRDQSARWQTRTESAIAERLTYRDIQMWRGSGVIGLVKDKNVNAYQCLSLANKIAVLENIVAEHFDSKLQHVEYKGPTYWLNAQNGKVDITEALKAGGANVYLNSNGDTKDGMVQIEGKVPQTTPPSGPK